MPEISRFLGIVIAMYYRDHAPPHFHAIYGEHEATVNIETGEPRSTLIAPEKMVSNWISTKMIKTRNHLSENVYNVQTSS